MASEIDRRSFLSILGITGASAAVSCSSEKSVNKLIPYVIPPENVRPGVWTHIATTCRECPAGCGMHVRHRDGRVVKAEGNPTHPVNKGGLCPRGQSAPQGLYDPDRVYVPLSKNGKSEFHPISWKQVISEIKTELNMKDVDIAVISDLQTGTNYDCIQYFINSYGSKRFLIYEPFNFESLKSANNALFNINSIPRYDLKDCEYILSFGADFLETWISPVEYAYQFGSIRSPKDHIPGTYVYFGPRLSMTAANADIFHMIQPGEEQFVVLAILQSLIENNLIINDQQSIIEAVKMLGGENIWDKSPLKHEQIYPIARSFIKASRSVALGSPVAARNSRTAFELSISVALLNYAAGRFETTIDFSQLHAFSAVASEQETNEFLHSISKNTVLVICNSNIAFTNPESVPFIEKAKSVIYLTTLPDETSQISSYILPLDSPLETWGDYEPYTGIHCVLQPSMARLHDSKGIGETFLKISNGEQKDFQTSFHDRWNQLLNNTENQNSLSLWNSVLRSGFFEEKKNVASIQLHTDNLQPFIPPEKESSKLPLWVWPSIMLYDGRLANRGWMQESPEPVSYASWSSWIDIHKETARKRKINENKTVKITTEKGSIELPVRITDQICPDTVSLILGQGHYSKKLNIARGIGANPFQIISYDKSLFGFADIEQTEKNEHIVYTTPTYNQHDRNILKAITFSGFQKQSFLAEDLIYPLHAGYTPHRDMYPPYTHSGHRWAMVVDLQRCIGCGACGVACYAENNIAVMGKIPVDNGREMAWLKIVPYAIPETSHLAWLPMLCQQCEAAPCEPVCPVYASVHNDEGLNAQIYNRCVGTRYCSNNCPYKVRRFNWFNTSWKTPLNMQLNPDVTVRCRGVMEKCTFCVQRIREVQYRAMVEHRVVYDGEIQPACVQSCPTKVFTFGDLLDPNAEVTKIITCDKRRYQVLKELNTKPAVIYLKKIINT